MTDFSFISRTIRQSVVPNGIRVLNVFNEFSAAGQQSSGFDLWGSIVSIANGIMAGIGVLQWTLQTGWNIICSIAGYILNFNWNPSDASTAASISAAINQVAGILGQLTGKTLGYLVCGALPTLSMFVFSPLAAEAIAPQVTADLIPQLAASYTAALQQIFSLLVQNTGQWVYAGVLRVFRGSDEDLKNSLIAQGFSQTEIAAQIQARNTPWTLSQGIQNAINAIPNDAFKSFLNGAYQSFGSSCQDAGYVVASALDGYLSMKRAGQGDTDLVVTFNPDGTTSITAIDVTATTVVSGS